MTMRNIWFWHHQLLWKRDGIEIELRAEASTWDLCTYSTTLNIYPYHYQSYWQRMCLLFWLWVTATHKLVSSLGGQGDISITYPPSLSNTTMNKLMVIYKTLKVYWTKQKTLLQWYRSMFWCISSTSFLYDVGFLSVCCEYILLPLVNKNAVLGIWQCRIEKSRNSK